MCTFAVLIPLNSRSDLELNGNLGKFKSISESLSNHSTSESTINVYLGIKDESISPNEGDKFAKSEAIHVLNQKGINSNNIKVSLIESSNSANIFTLWNLLCERAFEDGCHYFVPLTESTEFLSTDFNWPHHIQQAFHEMPLKEFGCLTFRDVDRAGRPSFPIVSRMHLEIFDGKLIPEEFIRLTDDNYHHNQQKNEFFLWDIYRRWGSTKVISNMKIRNTKDLKQEERAVGAAFYSTDEEKKKENTTGEINQPNHNHRVNWKGEKLQREIHVVRNWLEKNNHVIDEKFVIDVITPSYRVNRKLLSGIINIPVPHTCDTNFIVIVDNPKLDISWVLDEEQARESKYFYFS